MSYPVSSTNTTNHLDITEILLKVTSNPIILTPSPEYRYTCTFIIWFCQKKPKVKVALYLRDYACFTDMHCDVRLDKKNDKITKKIYKKCVARIF